MGRIKRAKCSSSQWSAVMVALLVQVWVQVWPYGTTSGEVEKHRLISSPSVIFTWPLLFFFFFLVSQGTLCYGEHLYLHKLMEINFACLVGILDRNSQMTTLA